MTKSQRRQIIFNKYNGNCAYCGIELTKGWTADHIKPKAAGGSNDLENMNPACKDCNNYKSHSSLETFRTFAKQMVNEKFHYLFKSKTKMQVAINLGAVVLSKWDGIFYFEKLQGKEPDPF